MADEFSTDFRRARLSGAVNAQTGKGDLVVGPRVSATGAHCACARAYARGLPARSIMGKGRTLDIYICLAQSGFGSLSPEKARIQHRVYHEAGAAGQVLRQVLIFIVGQFTAPPLPLVQEMLGML